MKDDDEEQFQVVIENDVRDCRQSVMRGCDDSELIIYLHACNIFAGGA